ncbi:MAG: DinB family protein [Saprospiraceae bacterium]|nr:DinB family protein [Saprospiraceae bacterium]
MNRTQLITQLQGLDSELNELLKSLSTYSHEALNKNPKEGAWSATQVLHHVKLAEYYSLKYCEKKLSFNPELGKVGWQEHLRGKLVKWYLQAPLKVKAPTIMSGSALPAESELSDIESEWKDQRKHLKKFFEDLPEEHIDKAVYKHPFGGRLSFGGMLAFYQAHFRRHQKQIWRTIPS